MEKEDRIAQQALQEVLFSVPSIALKKEEKDRLRLACSGRAMQIARDQSMSEERIRIICIAVLEMFEKYDWKKGLASVNSNDVCELEVPIGHASVFCYWR